MAFNLNAVRIFIVVLFIAIGQVHAETRINVSNGYITTDVTWTKENSPYILYADVQIERRGSLTIKEGVEVRVNGNRKKMKVGNRLLIEGTSEEKTSLSNINIVPADYTKTISINIYYANINNSSINFSDWNRRGASFNLENSTLNSVQVNGTTVKGSVNIKNNNFNSSNFSCYYCNYYDAGKGEFTATGNKFNGGSQLRISGGTKFKKVTINDNEFNKSSYGLKLSPYADWSWKRNKDNQGYEVLRNKFTKTHGGINARSGKYVINDNIFIESPGINYSGDWDNHKYEIKGNFFSKLKGFYAIYNQNIWNGRGDQATITDNMFCSSSKVALRISEGSNSNIVAGKNYWNTTSRTHIQDYMIYDHFDDLNIKRNITFGVHTKKQAPWLTSSQIDGCSAEQVEPETPQECTIGGTIYENTTLNNSCSAYNMISDYQIPKGITLTVDPDVTINGNNRKIKVEGELKINGAPERLVKMNRVNITPAGYPDSIKVNIYYANINNSSINFSDWNRRGASFNLENSTLNSVQVNGTTVKGSVNIKNNNFNSSNFSCYYCNYYDAGKGEFTATGNKFNGGSQLRISGGTKFKKVTINDNEFNKSSYGLKLSPYADWSWKRNKDNQGYEVLRNKFTKTHGGINARSGKYVINDNIFIESPGINYSGDWDNHKYEIKGNFFSKLKGFYAIYNQNIWNGRGDQATITDNMFCSSSKVALRISEGSNSNIVAGKNYWNTTSRTHIQDYMIYDHFDDLNIKRNITFGVHTKKQAPWLTSSQIDGCSAEQVEPETPQECTIGGTIYENTTLNNSCSAYNMISDYQIPKGITLTVDPDVTINGNNRKIKVEGELKINGAPERLVKMNRVNITPAGYPDSIKVNIYYANINNSSINFSDWNRRGASFNLENSTLNSVQVNGTTVKGSVNIKNNNFNSSNFSCYYCNYYDAGKGEFTATGNKFNGGSQLRISGGTKFKKVTINDNEFNKSSYGLKLSPYADWSWKRNKDNQGYEVLRNKFTKTHGGINARSGKYVINDNIFIESPGINYSGDWDNHKYEIKGNTFCKQKNYAISNSRVWNGNANQATIKSNNFCSVDRTAVRIGANRQSNMNAIGNYWNGATPSTIQRKMIWDRLDDINVYNRISWYKPLSTPTDELLGYSRIGDTALQACQPRSSTTAGSICAVICEGLDIEGDAPEPVVDPGAEIPLTFPPAVIIPRSTPKGSDAILQAIFNIRPGHQWEGHVKKYILNNDGSIGELQWDAGELLNTNKQAANRNIFTVGDGLSVLGNNNFKITNFKKLKPILYGDNYTDIDDEDAKKLINFVRGVDVFDEFSGQSERWKLGDTYHADLLVVGPPNARVTDNPEKANSDASYRYNKGYHNFALANKNRKSVVFAAANDGMLHAFDLTTGEELWAFIPPMVLPRLELMQSATAMESTSIYGVDGSPVYKDVYLQGRWRTVVMGGLGMGGHGYYALDVTDIEDPVHLFSFAYDPATQQGSVWRGQNGQKTLTSDFNKLGQAWSKPLMLRIPNYGWVAIFGGGFNNETDEYGSMVYIVDLENEGRLVKAISVDDSNNMVNNAIPASMTAITPDSSDQVNYTGAMVYFADLEGKLWKLDLTDQGSMFAMEQIFDAEASHPNKTPPGNGRFTYFPVAPSIGSDGKLRLFYGTGDMQDLMDSNQNVDNRFYGIKEEDFSNPAEQGRSNRFTESSLLDVTNETDICPDEDDRGWKIKLKPTEKVTSKANVSYGTVTFSRYTPLTTESCELGKTSITGVDYQCGSEEFNIDLGTGIATMPTLYRGKLYIGISGDAINTFTPPEGWIKKDNLLMGEPGDLSNWQGVKVKSWRESF